MAIGLGWADGAWVDAGWATSAWVTTTEIRVVCLNKSDGQPFASELVEYAIWPAGSLASFGAPTIQGTQTTTALGEIVVNVAGQFNVNDEVYVAVHQAAGGAGGSDDNFGFGSDTVTATV